MNGTLTLQKKDGSYFYSHIGIIIGAALLGGMMIALVGVIVYLKHWRKK